MNTPHIGSTPPVGPQQARARTAPAEPQQVDARGEAVPPAEVDLRKASAALFRDVDGPNVAWRYEAGHDSCSEPSVSADGGVVASDGKRLMKLRADGSLAWDVPTEKWSPFRPCALPGGGAVWAPEGKWLRAYDENGGVAWTFDAEKLQMQSIQPAVDRDGSVFVCVRDENIPYLVKLQADGSEAWRAKLPMHASAPPLLDGRGGCYARTDDDRMIALDDSGGERWSVKLPGGQAAVGWPCEQFNGRPAMAPDGSLWMGNDRGRVFRVSPDDGGAREIFKARSQVRGGVAFDGERAYVTSMDRHVYALDLSGKEIWRRDLGDMVEDGAVVLPGGDVMVSGVSGMVRAISPDGETRWTEQVDRGSSAMIVDARGTALMGAGKHVVAFRPGAALENLEKHVGALESPTITEQDGWIVIGDVRVPRREG